MPGRTPASEAVRSSTDAVLVDLSSDEGEIEVKVVGPRAKSKKAKNSSQAPEPRKRTLTESGRRRIEEARAAAATSNVLNPSDSEARKPECSSKAESGADGDILSEAKKPECSESLDIPAEEKKPDSSESRDILSDDKKPESSESRDILSSDKKPELCGKAEESRAGGDIPSEAKIPECSAHVESRTDGEILGDIPPPDVELQAVKMNGKSKIAKATSTMRAPPKKRGRKPLHEATSEAPVSKKKKKGDSESESESESEASSESDVEYEKTGKEPEETSSRPRPRRAAAGTNFKEKRTRLDEKNALIDVKEERSAEGEDVAIVLTSQAGEDPPPQRRIVDFVIHDEDGMFRPVESLEVYSLYITSLVLPYSGPLDKEKAVRCEGFGPVTSWSIMGYEKSAPTLVLCTDLAEYYCDRPAGNYKKLYNILFEKAKVCVEVYRNLSKPEGGDPCLHLDELIARVSRSFSKQGNSGQFFNREFILTHGKLIASQLTALDEFASDSEQLFSGLPSLVSLEQEGTERSTANYFRSSHPVANAPLKIHDVSSCANGGASAGTNAVSDPMEDDEKLARFLQEDEDRISSRPGRKAATVKGKYYIKINENEIANDYPLPAYYKAEEEEMDEYILFDDVAAEDPEDLPHRKLHDWTLYNSDSRLVSLELLPMLRGAETDMEIFGSGIITEDDGSGFCVDDDAIAVGSSGGDISFQKSNNEQGIRVYLSAVKEWKIEFGASMLFISFRTDGAWYRLGKPSGQYVGWYQPVLRTARLAVRIITMLKDELRVNRLSLNDVIKKLAEQSRDELTYIGSKVDYVQRYVVVHGQIILQQFSEYPDETIKRCAFITGLALKMEELNHTKLILSKKKILVKKERNLNPRATLFPDGNKRKPMRATTTKLVDRIWSAYYAGSEEANAPVEESPEKDVEVLEEEIAEESDEEEETVVETKSCSRALPKKPKEFKASRNAVQWIGNSTGKTTNNELVYERAVVNGVEFTAGKSVSMELYEGSDEVDRAPAILRIEYLYETKNGPMLHGRVLARGTDTVLGNAAFEREVFLTDSCEDVQINKTKGLVTVEMRKRDFGHAYRKENAIKDDADRASAKEREEKGLPIEYFCRSWYSPGRGAFISLPAETLAVGIGICKACEARQETEKKQELQFFPNGGGFRYQSIEYRVGDYAYLDPDTFETGSETPAQKVLYKGGRNKGLRAFAICELLTVLQPQNNSKKTRLMKVRRFYRPEDVDKLKAYKADIHEVYYSEETATVEITTVRGKCVVRRQLHEVAASEECAVNHVFFCSCIHDPKKGTVKQLPNSVKLSMATSLEATAGKSQAEEITAKAKGKGKAIESTPVLDRTSDSALATLDIFAGCGGLSEGLHQSGVSITKWAIEYDYPASEAFKVNHPTADVFCDNCNVILRSIMEMGGDLEDCVSTPEADELSLRLEDERKRKLPKPHEVDFISGGPPCQGFSGMNRFNQRAWSKVQCEMILSYLSYAEYFRPRYFLLENVRNFVSFNKGQTFRLSLASLLEMGYQVRFGVLQAGNYGVSQSRKRAFIWAAAPDDILPEWPEPRHVFSSSQLGVTLPGGAQYSAVRDAARGAPLRPITVRDTIGDLPAVENGANKEEISYVNQPESWFQVQIRGQQTVLFDHTAKEMNELNLIRCQRIPKEPGADWRTLPEEKVKLSTGQIVDLIPWCLPNTADRHNQWKGLFGRLDWDGNFPTSITDPQPMGKVGMCFHPEQDRIITVRECARSQGFPDGYKFFGNINSKHRQIGNAVPPPLARALGHMLKEAIRTKKDLQGMRN